MNEEILICNQCGEEGAKRTRQKSNYICNELNYDILCDECQQEADEYWEIINKNVQKM